MSYLIFENDGEIDLRMISTFGCSVKETANPIGYFGTGLKFAIAVLLRTGHTIVVQSGKNVHPIEVRTEKLRDRDFDMIYTDGMPLGFTTELGKNWEVWMAYRELYCNAKDEVNSRIAEDVDYPQPIAGKTRFIISGERIMTAHRTRHEFILEGEPDMKIGSLEVFNRPSRGFFYRRIKVMNLDAPAMFAYNQTEHVELTEDRTVKDPHTVRYSISRAIMAYAPAEVLDRVLVAPQGQYEYNFDFHGWSNTPSADFFKTVDRLQRNALCKVNASAIRVWREKGQGFINPRRITPTSVQAKMLEKAIDFCQRSGFPLRDEYPIFIVETLGETGVMAMSDRTGKQIWLAERIFNQSGTKGVARALAEEYIHLKFGLNDETREMQNFIFDKMISLAEQLQGEPL